LLCFAYIHFEPFEEETRVIAVYLAKKKFGPLFTLMGVSELVDRATQNAAELQEVFNRNETLHTFILSHFKKKEK
jgi:hypothetical protein